MPEKNNPVPRRSGIELKGIVLRVPSNQIKVTFIIILPFNLIHWGFFSLFHKDIEGKCRWIIGGGGVGGGKGYVGPPSQILGGPAPCPLPLPTPMFDTKYTYCIYIYTYRQGQKLCVKMIRVMLFFSTQNINPSSL